MAVRNTKAAHELILKWQYDWSGKGLPLNIEVFTEHTCKFWTSIFLEDQLVYQGRSKRTPQPFELCIGRLIRSLTFEGNGA